MTGDSNISGGDTLHMTIDEGKGRKSNVGSTHVFDPELAKAVTQEAKAQMTLLLETANKLYKCHPRKEHYDFLVTLESANRAKGF